MATKKEIFESTTSEVQTLCEQSGTPKKFNVALMEILANHLEPKAGGASVNIEDVTKTDADGNITEIQCSVSGVFLPATVEYFYEDKAGKGINGLKRLSRQAESVRKQYIKTLAATEKAIMADVLDGAMTPEEGKAKLVDAKAIKPDYSTVAVKVAEEPEAE